MLTILLVDTDPGMADVVGEVEQLCHERRVNVMVHHLGEDLGDILDSAHGKLVVMSPRGDSKLKDAISAEGDILVAIGGFREGDFLSPIYERADEVVSLGDELLEIPIVTTRVLDEYEKTRKRQRTGR
jgi:rRNA pseudouridine-1189 N-methylase Emg1 (Nep1/Mra1 family)